jgi:hypothetical protein
MYEKLGFCGSYRVHIVNTLERLQSSSRAWRNTSWFTQGQSAERCIVAALECDAHPGVCVVKGR